MTKGNICVYAVCNYYFDLDKITCFVKNTSTFYRLLLKILFFFCVCLNFSFSLFGCGLVVVGEGGQCNLQLMPQST